MYGGSDGKRMILTQAPIVIFSYIPQVSAEFCTPYPNDFPEEEIIRGPVARGYVCLQE